MKRKEDEAENLKKEIAKMEKRYKLVKEEIEFCKDKAAKSKVRHSASSLFLHSHDNLHFLSFFTLTRSDCE